MRLIACYLICLIMNRLTALFEAKILLETLTFMLFVNVIWSRNEPFCRRTQSKRERERGEREEEREEREREKEREREREEREREKREREEREIDLVIVWRAEACDLGLLISSPLLFSLALSVRISPLFSSPLSQTLEIRSNYCLTRGHTPGVCKWQQRCKAISTLIISSGQLCDLIASVCGKRAIRGCCLMFSYLMPRTIWSCNHTRVHSSSAVNQSTVL